MPEPGQVTVSYEHVALMPDLKGGRIHADHLGHPISEYQMARHEEKQFERRVRFQQVLNHITSIHRPRSKQEACEREPSDPGINPVVLDQVNPSQ